MSVPCRDAQPTVATLGEHGLIDRIRARVPDGPRWVVLGIGDDAAVLEPARGELDVVTTDGLVEDVHFRRDWTPARAIGHKALAVNLSDLAAMGASPRAALLNLALPAGLPLADFDEILDGLLALAHAVRVPLVGGNITRSPGPLMVDVTVIGAARRRRVLTRSGGRHGDALYVTGSLGAASTGLALLERGESRTALSPALAECIDRYERPQPRLRTGVAVARNRGASACVDLSDGLADAVHQLTQASGLGAVIQAAHLPVHPGAIFWAERMNQSAITTAASGGEDYELLFAVPPKRRNRFRAATEAVSDVPVTCIGHLTRDPGVWFEHNGQRDALGPGFTHF
jgi:thiamine-monophosphate kinase